MSRPRRTPADFSDADADLAAALDNLAGADNYLALLYELFRPSLGRRILEIGAGHGDFTEMFAQHGEVYATDLSERCVAVLDERFAGDDRVSTGMLDIGSEGGVSGYDTAVLVNVLEHVPDDLGALKNLRDMLDGGGAIILYVPAFEMLYGDFDHKIGHYRRYRKSDLRETVEAAGLQVETLRYVNMPGFFAWLLTVRLLRQIPTSKTMVRIYDRLVVPVLRVVETRWAPPFGQSLICVARTPA